MPKPCADLQSDAYYHTMRDRRIPLFVPLPLPFLAHRLINSTLNNMALILQDPVVNAECKWQLMTIGSDALCIWVESHEWTGK